MKKVSRKTRLGAVLLLSLALAACGGGGGGSQGLSTGNNSNNGNNSPNPTVGNTGEISGTINIAAHTRVDADTADQAEVGNFIPLNNTSPQHLPSPVILAGYLSDSSGQYPSVQGSNSKAQGFFYPQDEHDLYQLSLATTQTLVWQIFRTRADSSSGSNVRASLSLFPVNSDGTVNANAVPVATATTDGSKPVRVQLPSGYGAGTYQLDLSVSGGPIRYVLSVSSQAAASSLPLVWNQAAFLPDRALVKMTDDQGTASVESAYNNLNIASAQSLGNGMLRVDRIPPDIAQPLSAGNRTRRLARTLRWIRQLRKQGKVAVAEPDYLYHALAASPTPESQPLYALQWNMPMISMPSAWQLESKAGQGVTVAVLDTGIYRNISSNDTAGKWHPDFYDPNGKTNIVQGYDEVSPSLDVDSEVPGEAFGPSGPDDDPADPGDNRGHGSSFHGTHVAGIIGAAVNAIGVTGVAYDANIMPVRVLGKGGEGSASDIINAINWVDNGHHPLAQIINMSLGGLSPSTTLQDAINRAVNDGIVIVAAAGNDGTSAPSYPAGFANVIAVGAVDGGENLASYSNYGSWVDLVAPGGDPTRDANGDGRPDYIVSTWADDSSGSAQPGYAGLAGTSMAAPHVAGVIALMDEAKGPGSYLNFSQFQALLEKGELTDDLGDRTRFGYGLIDAAKAVKAAMSGNIPTILTPSPSVISLSASAAYQDLTLTPSGAGVSSIQITIPGSNPCALSIDNSSFTGSQSRYVVRVSAPVSRFCQSELDVQYTTTGGATNNLTVPVMVTASDDVAQRNAGMLFILLTQKDPNNNNVVVQQEVAQPAQGQYHFDFRNLSPGQYEIEAGTDLDDDGYICTSGEACAEYPSLGSLQPISVTSGPVTGLTMTASYTRPVAASLALPRPGFEGYSRQPAQTQAAVRQTGGGNASP